MADNSAIEWTEASWNATTGCDRISPGCDNCYALTLAGRLKKMGQPKYQNDGDPRTSGPGFGVTVHPDALDAPKRWRKPRLIFVDSMSDLFHARIPDEFIARVFATMADTPQHTYQLLTKRPRRMRRLLNSPEFADMVFGFADGWETRQRLVRPTRDDPMPVLPGVWLGVSVEDQEHAELRVPDLLRTPAAVRFLSCEPILGPVSLRAWLAGATAAHRDPTPISWVIVGGESGADHRPPDPGWVRALRDQCVSAHVNFFFKQWGGRTPKSGGRLLDGRTWDQMPAAVHA